MVCVTSVLNEMKFKSFHGLSLHDIIKFRKKYFIVSLLSRAKISMLFLYNFIGKNEIKVNPEWQYKWIVCECATVDLNGNFQETYQ